LVSAAKARPASAVHTIAHCPLSNYAMPAGNLRAKAPCLAGTRTPGGAAWTVGAVWAGVSEHVAPRQHPSQAGLRKRHVSQITSDHFRSTQLRAERLQLTQLALRTFAPICLCLSLFVAMCRLERRQRASKGSTATRNARTPQLRPHMAKLRDVALLRSLLSAVGRCCVFPYPLPGPGKSAQGSMLHDLHEVTAHVEPKGQSWHCALSLKKLPAKANHADICWFTQPAPVSTCQSALFCLLLFGAMIPTDAKYVHHCLHDQITLET